MTPAEELRERMRRSKAEREERTKARCEAIEAGFKGFRAPLEDAAATHAEMVERTVVGLEEKYATLWKNLAEERSRRKQISVSFLSLLRDMKLEYRDHCERKRIEATQHLETKFQVTLKRLHELQARIPREQKELVDEITAQSEE